MSDYGAKAKMVHRLEFYNSLEIPDLEIKRSLADIFPRMVNLRCLVWNASPELTADVLETLSNPTIITTLSLDMAIRTDNISRHIAHLNFDNLAHLIIRPFVCCEILVLLAKMLSNCSALFNRLETLFLGRELQSNHQVGSGFAFATFNAQNYVQMQVERRACKSFFGTLTSC